MHRRSIRLHGLLIGFVAVSLAGIPRVAAEDPAPSAPAETNGTDIPAIADHMAVQLEYTLTADGQVVDSTQGREPFRYVQGAKQIIPGLERQLAGLHAGDERDITVAPEEGYGPVDPSAVVDVPKEQLPKTVTPTPGLMLSGIDPQGHPFRATIQAVKDTTVTLNLNHPLAGKTLLFKIKVISVAPAP